MTQVRNLVPVYSPSITPMSFENKNGSVVLNRNKKLTVFWIEHDLKSNKKTVEQFFNEQDAHDRFETLTNNLLGGNN